MDGSQVTPGGPPWHRMGWAALAAAIAVTIVVVPPLVMPRGGDGERQAVAPAPTSVTPAGPSVAAPSPSPAAPSQSPSLPASLPASSRPVVPRRTASPATTPIEVHAADPANLRNGARIIECATCDGGQRVGYIGGPNTLAIRVTGVTRPGRRTLTVVYETAEPRTLKVAVNDGAPQVLQHLAGASDWLIPARVSLPVELPAGSSWIRFFNDAGSAPDINRIVIT